MSLKDSLTENDKLMAMEVMLNSNGWLLLWEELDAKIDYYKNRLTSVEPSDTVNIARYQSAIRTINDVRSIAKGYINKKQEE